MSAHVLKKRSLAPSLLREQTNNTEFARVSWTKFSRDFMDITTAWLRELALNILSEK